jgi:hypothetical protein
MVVLQLRKFFIKKLKKKKKQNKTKLAAGVALDRSGRL